MKKINHFFKCPNIPSKKYSFLKEAASPTSTEAFEPGCGEMEREWGNEEELEKNEEMERKWRENEEMERE